MTAARTATVRISLRSVFCQYSGAPRFIIESGVRDSHRTASNGPNRGRYKSLLSIVSFPLRTAILYTHIFVFLFLYALSLHGTVGASPFQVVWFGLSRFASRVTWSSVFWNVHATRSDEMSMELA